MRPILYSGKAPHPDGPAHSCFVYKLLGRPRGEGDDADKAYELMVEATDGDTAYISARPFTAGDIHNFIDVDQIIGVKECTLTEPTPSQPTPLLQQAFDRQEVETVLQNGGLVLLGECREENDLQAVPSRQESLWVTRDVMSSVVQTSHSVSPEEQLEGAAAFAAGMPHGSQPALGPPPTAALPAKHKQPEQEEAPPEAVGSAAKPPRDTVAGGSQQGGPPSLRSQPSQQASQQASQQQGSQQPRKRGVVTGGRGGRGFGAGARRGKGVKGVVDQSELEKRTTAEPE
eukprot:scaffold3.g6363.t1